MGSPVTMSVEEALNRATALRRQGHWDAAVALTERILAADADNADANLLMAQLQIEGGRPDACEPFLRKVERRFAGVPEVVATRIKQLFVRGESLAGTAMAYGYLAARPDGHVARAALYWGMARCLRADPALGSDEPVAAATRPDRPLPSISVIICSIDPEKWRRVTANYGVLLAGTDHEIIGIHDARSLCDGYGRGFARSRGDIVIFSHDDIELLSPDFAGRIAGLLERFALVGLAGTTKLTGASWFNSGWPHQKGIITHRRPTDTSYRVDIFATVDGPETTGIQALDGLFMAARRSVVEAIGFDGTTFDGFHLYDTDFSFRAFQAGHALAIVHDIPVIHASTGNMGADWRVHADRFRAKFASVVPDEPMGPNPFRACFVGTRAQVAAMYRAQLALAQGADWRTVLSG